MHENNVTTMIAMFLIAIVVLGIASCQQHSESVIALSTHCPKEK